MLLQRAFSIIANSGKTLKMSGCSRLNMRRYKSAYEGDGKSTATILNLDIDLGLMIDSISVAGFRLNNGTVVLGPLALFHRSVLSWSVGKAANINAESLSLFKVLDPKVDFVVMGLGDPEDTVKYSSQVIKLCKQINLNVEIYPTEDACATFNFLNSEGRHIAALLIPPAKIRMNDGDLISFARTLEISRTIQEKREEIERKKIN